MDENQKPQKNPVQQQPSPKPNQAPTPPQSIYPQPSNGQLQVGVTGASIGSAEKSKGWKIFFILLAIINILYIPLLILTTVLGSYAYALLLIFTPLFFPSFALDDLYPYVASGILVIDVLALSLFIFKRRPKEKGLVIATIVALILILMLQGVFALQKIEGGLPGLLGLDPSISGKKKSEQRRQEFAAANAKPEITKEEAIQLLKTCKLKGFYYTNQTDKSDPANGGWGELSSTGVVLTKVDGQPYRISIADKLIPELVPIAREAQKTCANPQFWHDGTYEQYKDGKWYFKGEVVNSTQSGKTKEEAISFMQNCKADYFVGYTDINLVKNSSTKSWLDKAEQSSTGIEISEGSPKSYVFASKAMTTALQDTARQFRQSCYNTKKLYITIDDWIETEYPQGKWTRVKQ